MPTLRQMQVNELQENPPKMPHRYNDDEDSQVTSTTISMLAATKEDANI